MGVTKATARSVAREDDRVAQIDTRIVACVAEQPGVNLRDLLAAAGGRKETAGERIEVLLSEGLIIRTVKGSAFTHYPAARSHPTGNGGNSGAVSDCSPVPHPIGEREGTRDDSCSQTLGNGAAE
jgi:hypothetical protein